MVLIRAHPIRAVLLEFREELERYADLWEGEGGGRGRREKEKGEREERGGGKEGYVYLQVHVDISYSDFPLVAIGVGNVVQYPIKI